MSESGKSELVNILWCSSHPSDSLRFWGGTGRLIALHDSSVAKLSEIWHHLEDHVLQPGIGTQSAIDKDWSGGQQGGFSWKGLVLSQCLDLFTKFFILSFSNNFALGD